MIARTCDYCGHPIDDTDDEYVAIDGRGTAEVDGGLGWIIVNASLGDYHATGERPCWWQARDAIRLLTRTHADLASIPVASPQKIGALRRRHTREA